MAEISRLLPFGLFGTNTVLCVLPPSYISRGVARVIDALRQNRYSAMFFVASCPITMVTSSTTGLLTALLAAFHRA